MESKWKCEIHGEMEYGSELFWKCRREHPLLLQKVIREFAPRR
jgi:hypothetical protein